MTEAPRSRDTAAIGGLALLVRLAVVVWAAPRFPPVMDGDFYHRVAQRIAARSSIRFRVASMVMQVAREGDQRRGWLDALCVPFIIVRN